MSKDIACYFPFLWFDLNPTKSLVFTFSANLSHLETWVRLTFSPDLTATQSSHGFPRLSKHLTSISSPLQIMKVGGGFKRNYGIMLQQRGRGRCLSFLDNSVGRDRFPFLPIVSNNRIIGDQNVCWWGFSWAELCGQFKYQLRETSEYGNTFF